MKSLSVHFLLSAFLTVLGSQQIVAQYLSAFQFVPQPAFTRIGVDAWASGSSGVAEVGLQSAMFNNPAAMRFCAPTISVELGKRFATKSLLDFESDGQFLLPQFIAAGISFEKVNLSAGYANYYDNQLVSSPILVTTENDPFGAGESIRLRWNLNVHSFLLSSNYSFSDQVTIGASLGLNYLHMNEEAGRARIRGNALGLHSIVGAIVKPVEDMTVGISFRYSSRIGFEPDIEGLRTGLIGDSLRPGNFYRIETLTSKSNFPWSAELGIAWAFLPSARLFASVEFVNWQKVVEQYLNRVHVHAGCAFVVSSIVEMRLGFFTQKDPNPFIGEAFDQNFVTGGARFSFSNWAIAVSLLDSHLFNQEQRILPPVGQKTGQFHQTILSAGLSYLLN